MGAEAIVVDAAAVDTLEDLALLLRQLRRRQGRQLGRRQLSYRDLAAMTGWSHGIIGEYLAGHILPPVDRFDLLVALLDASPVERGAMATARDRVEDARWHRAVAEPPNDSRLGRLGPDRTSADLSGSDHSGSDRSGSGRAKPGRVVPACVSPDRTGRDEVMPPSIALTPGPERQRAERQRAERRGYLRRKWQPCQAVPDRLVNRATGDRS